MIKTNINYLKELRILQLIKDGVIGLMGGSFNPPHYGHLHISEALIRKFNLNQIVWLVSPGNPLKDRGNLLPLKKRIELCQNLTKHNTKIVVSALESSFNNSYTYITIKEIQKFIQPNTKLIWIMGEDNLFNFDKFFNWKKIASNIPIVVISRKENSTKTLLQKAPRILKNFYISPNEPQNLYKKLPAWSFWLTKNTYISSTEVRNTTKEHLIT